MFFTAKRKIGGPRELWISDGSESGTMMVDAQEGRDLINLGNVLIFWRWDALEGYRLWKSDGTAQGTIPIAFIAPPEVQEEPKEFIVVNGKLYFTADDGSHGRELWCYDPAFESAFMVADIRPGPDSGGPIVLTKVGTMLFFQYWTDEYWYELWALDTREALIPTISPIGAAALFGSLLVAGCLMSKRLGGPRSQTRGHD